MMSPPFLATASLLLLLALGSFISHAEAHDRQVTSKDKIVALPVQAVQYSGSLAKRQSPIPIPNWWSGLEYHVNITIGSNNQTVPILFDTGSDVMWVNPNCGKAEGDYYNKIQKAQCYANPRYNPFKSETAKILNEAFNHTHGAGSVMGVYFTDDVRMGTLIAKNQQFGVAVDDEFSSAGVLGAQAVVVKGKGTNHTHTSFVKTLVDQGQINSAAFGLDLRSINETGSVIFGGIDTKKYKCELYRIPSKAYWINLTDIGLTYPNKTSIKYEPKLWNKHNNTAGLPVWLDNGTPANILPNAFVQALARTYPNVTQTKLDGTTAYIVPCDAPAGGTIDFTFGTANIKVSWADLMYNQFGTCYLNFVLNPDDGVTVPYLLSASFLRGVYAVFDSENNNVWLGESDDCGSNVLPIQKGENGVPVVKGCRCSEAAPSTVEYASPTATKGSY